MARFEDSPDLFGSGLGTSTLCNITCGWCGHTYDGREDANGDPINEFNDTIGNTRFGELQICECCYEKVEAAVFARIDDIIPWFVRIIESKKRLIQDQEEVLNELRRHLMPH